jgi:Cdc6-like AAA superfamily ATPase
MLLLHVEETLKGLKPVSSARYNSRGSPEGCLQDTRENVLGTMASWVAKSSSSSSSMSVFWLAGLAGTGKSTIIKTFCQRVSDDDRFLLAGFFASRNSAERRDPYRILHTFAYQLAITSECIRTHVLSAVRAPEDIMEEPMVVQAKQLLAESIARAQLCGRTVVFVIDALDECQKIAGVEGGSLIDLLAQALQHQPVKLFVTSRPEDSVVNLFRSLPHVPLSCHEISSQIVEADVRKILNAGFADIRRKCARDVPADSWPTRFQMDALVHLAH